MRALPRFALATAAAALTALCVGPAAAQEGDARARAAALYQEANGLYKAGQTAQAEAKYEQAWKLQPSFEIATNLANVELLLGQTAEAAQHLTHALRVMPANRPEADRAKIEALLAEARAKVGSYDVQTDAGAVVLVNGVAVGIAPLPGPVFVMPGEHTLAAERDGRRGSRKVAADAGTSEIAVLEIEEAQRPPMLPPTGEVSPVGDDGMSWVPGLVVGGAGLVAIGVGAGLLVAAGSAADESLAIRDDLVGDGVTCGAAATDPRCEEGLAADDRHGTLQVAGGVVFGVGLAAAATGAVLLIVGATDDETAPTARTTLVPMVDAHRAGFFLNGSF